MRQRLFENKVFLGRKKGAQKKNLRELIQRYKKEYDQELKALEGKTTYDIGVKSISE